MMGDLWLGPWRLEVDGLPRPKGSWKCVGQHGRHQLVEQVESKEWRQAVKLAAHDLLTLLTLPIEGPVGVSCVFTVPLPKSVKPEKRLWPAIAGGVGDADKLARSVLDSITAGGLWGDDGQVCELLPVKAYPHSPGEQLRYASAADIRKTPGAIIRIWPM